MTGALLLAGFAAWALIVGLLRAYRIWLFYYVLATAGCAYGLVFAARSLVPGELLLSHSVAEAVHLVCSALGIPTRIFDGAPDVLLVLVITQQIGWTVLQIGVESSGLLETSVLVSLLLFYPGWSLGRRLGLAGAGILATWVANVIRVLVIVLILRTFGKESLVLAHTFIGKALFFVFTLAIYWRVITWPTLRGLKPAPPVRRPAV